MKDRGLSRIGQIFADGRRIDAALRSAVRAAIRDHGKHNQPVVIWRDGRIAWVPAKELDRTTLSKAARTKKTPPKRAR
jgi:hypothetical protein